MAKGIDTDTRVSLKDLESLYGEGYTFIGRYYGQSKRSPLTLQEAQDNKAAKLYTVSVYESGEPVDKDYFTYARGVSDGKFAYSYAMSDIGQPSGTPVYFAVDYDATNSDFYSAILPYFTGVRTSFANGTGNPSHRYFLGVYGSGAICEDCLEAGVVSYAWVAESVDGAATASQDGIYARVEAGRS